MKKLFFASALFLFLFFSITDNIHAKVDCPSPEMQCQELDAKGGCSSPCVRIVTVIGIKSPSWCQCVIPNIPPGTIACGGVCQIKADCGSDCPYCRASGGAGQTCQKENTATTDTDLWCDSEKTQLNTAIGCIPILTTKEAFLSFVLKWAVGIGGGIAFLLIIYAGFMIMTSAGNPERLKAGQELLTSAISGLILLIFSVVILKIIGVDILGLNQFGFNQ